MKKTTMQNIADDLGMSRTTVSLVLTGKADRYRISRHTQERVLARVRELDFRPNYFARALNRNRSGVMGVVFPNLFEHFMTELVKGIEDELTCHDYTMMLCTSRFDIAQERRIIRDLAHREVDGYILACYAPFRDEAYDDSHLRELVAGPRPVVFVDRFLPSLAAHRVVQNDHEAAATVTRALVQAGCTRLLCVSFDIDITSVTARLQGFREAVATATNPEVRGHILRIGSRSRSADELELAIRQYASQVHPPDGVFVTTNGLAYRTREVLEAMGYRIGSDVLLAKFGSDPPYHTSEMICLEQPHTEMGRTAARTVLSLLTDQDAALPLEQVVPSRLRMPEATQYTRRIR
jgi:DNA-binding LacI/PurR family transcriptional regulator